MTPVSPQNRQRVADTVAATLHRHGIRLAFGMPGGEVVTLVDALERAGIAFHLARHETAAALMAAGASTTSGSPGLLVTTVGPGLANAVNGIADAAQEHVPLIVISGIVDRDTRTRYTHQVIDHAAMLAPLVKASFEVDEHGAGSTVARALALALAEPMGPVHLDLSPAVAAMADPSHRVISPPEILNIGINPDDPAVARIAARLEGAERPIILAGFEAARSGAGPALLALAEKRGIPVITTYKAKGVVPEDHPLALGGAGLSPAADAVLLQLLRSCDLALMIGYDPIEMRLGWLDPLETDAQIVEMMGAAPDHAMHHAGLRLNAPVAASVSALLKAVAKGTCWPNGEPSLARKTLQAKFQTPAPWGPHAIIDAIAKAAGRDAVVTVDSGAHRILLSQKWQAHRPLCLLQSAGFCTMAAALPLAIGAKAANPERQVFAVMGDGGLEMGIGELATLRDLGLPVTVVLFQDQSLALIAMKQSASGLASRGVTLGNTDFATVARGFGGTGINVTDSESLAVALNEAASASKFTLIACGFDADAYKNSF